MPCHVFFILFKLLLKKAIIFILFLIGNLVQSVFFFFYSRSYTFFYPRLRKLFNRYVEKGFNRCIFICNFIKISIRKVKIARLYHLRAFQSIVARLLLRLSGLKCKRSRFLICFRLIVSLVDVKYKTAKNDR